MSATLHQESPRPIGRYVLFEEIASGGMATVHLGRLRESGGLSSTVAIKRLHAQFAKAPAFVSMFLNEAQVAARIRHHHVVSTLEVVAEGGEVFLVMEYVHGESLARLFAAMRASDSRMPWPLACFVVAQALLGLHAAHEATTESGEPLNLVHRDVSPHNLLLGSDGVVRVADFGLAKAAASIGTTPNDVLKGKIDYIAPEQLRNGAIDRRADVFAASVVLYEALTGRRPFAAEEPAATLANILMSEVEPPSRFVPQLPRELDALVLKGLERDAERRFATAHEMARALQAAVAMPSVLELGDWMQSICGEVLQQRSRAINRIENQSVPRATASERSRWIATAAVAALGSSLLIGGLSDRGEPSRVALDAADPIASQDIPKEPSPPRGAFGPPNVAPSAPPTGALPRSTSAKRSRQRQPFPRGVENTFASSAAAAACTPPYTFNPDGSKRFKPGCF